ncbi:MAG: RND transporter [Polaribacter sp. BACL8 MAG-120419-bin8]|jgi:membrane fusion protein, multidrug efflux system|nr:MAG: RND transporter [Polaribacter sp. BACL8 MAG-120419-bin8]MDA8810325.1 efflux RND transporter periplasmic adaptor subunit [Flavobacteriaceae bacterium]MDB4172556.1 efflux RND transporter periplasmic adaptor subunit [Flavobacteriaceae bacterium]MDC1472840.1 efflux RND transporter periplasmic adaptor subunit [Flavobacteriaceae bacterium]MDC6456915.1 efflux RND transporter periplasmic adaptor subunit [Flavobacteriaceae bacterium]
MKKIYPILALSILLVACGSSENGSVSQTIESGDLEAIRSMKTNLTNQLNGIETDLAALEAAIANLDTNENLPLVTTFEVQPQVFNHYLDLQGNVKTRENVLLYPEMAGTLLTVKVKKGARVSKGQILAVIDNGGMSNQLSQLKTQAALAQTTFERQATLWEQKIGSEIQYLQSKAQAEAQANAVLQLEKVLAKAQITAPFSGVIDQVLKDPGTVVSPGNGSEVFRLINLSNMYIEVDVPEGYLGAVTKGKKAGVYFPVLQDSVNAVVRETGNYINPNNRSFSAEIAVENPNGSIKPNLNARVHINDYTNENALLIPQSVISENAAGEQYAYVAELNNGEAIAKRHIITTGKTQGDFVEITSGISAGDLIIKEGARSVKDAQAVKILN